jgi:hypothetical protein
MSLYIVVGVGTEVFIDNIIKPKTMFFSLVAGTLVSSMATLFIDLDLPD